MGWHGAGECSLLYFTPGITSVDGDHRDDIHMVMRKRYAERGGIVGDIAVTMASSLRCEERGRIRESMGGALFTHVREYSPAVTGVRHRKQAWVEAKSHKETDILVYIEDLSYYHPTLIFCPPISHSTKCRYVCLITNLLPLPTLRPEVHRDQNRLTPALLTHISPGDFI